MLPQHPELATVVHNASFSLDTYRSALTDIMGCRNGNVIIIMCDGSKFKVRVHSPLRPEGVLAVLPAFPCLKFQDGYTAAWSQLLSKEEGDGLSYISVWVESTKERKKSIFHTDMLRNGDVVWRTHLNWATDWLLCPRWKLKAVLASHKVYIASAQSDIVILDLMVSSISTIQLPRGVEYGDRDITLARADDALGVYLIFAKNLQLYIWLHKEDNWLLMDTICLQDMIANLRMTGCNVADEPTAPLRINHMGDYCEFVFLEIGRCVFHLDIKCRQLRKVYDMTENCRCLGDIYPSMMIWPPRFPVLKDDATRFAFSPLGYLYKSLVEVTKYCLVL